MSLQLLHPPFCSRRLNLFDQDNHLPLTNAESSSRPNTAAFPSRNGGVHTKFSCLLSVAAIYLPPPRQREIAGSLSSLARPFKAPNNMDDFREMQRCLDEAERVGVIMSNEAVLGDAVLAQQFQDEIRALHRAGVMICQRLLQIEERVQDLDKSFTRYKKVERTTKLFRMALQLIPIAGRAAADVLSSGAEIVDCLSVKDVTDYVLGTVQASDEEVMSFTAQLFGNARESIAPETLNKIDENKKREFVEIVKSSGYSMEMLHILFQDPSCEVESTATVVTLEESSRPDNVASAVDVDVDTSANGDHTEVKPSEQAGDEAQEGSLNVLAKHDAREQSKRLNFKSVKLSREVIGSSTPIDLAKLWTTFILRSEEDTAEYQVFFSCIRDVLSENDICGALLVVQDKLGENVVGEMGDIVMAELKENEQVCFTIGKQILARRFITEIYTVCHGECSAS